MQCSKSLMKLVLNSSMMTCSYQISEEAASISSSLLPQKSSNVRSSEARRRSGQDLPIQTGAFRWETNCILDETIFLPLAMLLVPVGVMSLAEPENRF